MDSDQNIKPEGGNEAEESGDILENDAKIKFERLKLAAQLDRSELVEKIISQDHINVLDESASDDIRSLLMREYSLDEQDISESSIASELNDIVHEIHEVAEFHLQEKRKEARSRLEDWIGNLLVDQMPDERDLESHVKDEMVSVLGLAATDSRIQNAIRRVHEKIDFKKIEEEERRSRVVNIAKEELDRVIGSLSYQDLRNKDFENRDLFNNAMTQRAERVLESLENEPESIRKLVQSEVQTQVDALYDQWQHNNIINEEQSVDEKEEYEKNITAINKALWLDPSTIKTIALQESNYMSQMQQRASAVLSSLPDDPKLKKYADYRIRRGWRKIQKVAVADAQKELATVSREITQRLDPKSRTDFTTKLQQISPALQRFKNGLPDALIDTIDNKFNEWSALQAQNKEIALTKVSTWKPTQQHTTFTTYQQELLSTLAPAERKAAGQSLNQLIQAKWKHYELKLQEETEVQETKDQEKEQAESPKQEEKEQESDEQEQIKQEREKAMRNVTGIDYASIEGLNLSDTEFNRAVGRVQSITASPAVRQLLVETAEYFGPFLMVLAARSSNFNETARKLNGETDARKVPLILMESGANRQILNGFPSILSKFNGGLEMLKIDQRQIEDATERARAIEEGLTQGIIQEDDVEDVLEELEEPEAKEVEEELIEHDIIEEEPSDTEKASQKTTEDEEPEQDELTEEMPREKEASEEGSDITQNEINPETQDVNDPQGQQEADIESEDQKEDEDVTLDNTSSQEPDEVTEDIETRTPENEESEKVVDNSESDTKEPEIMSIDPLEDQSSAETLSSQGEQEAADVLQDQALDVNEEVEEVMQQDDIEEPTLPVEDVESSTEEEEVMTDQDEQDEQLEEDVSSDDEGLPIMELEEQDETRLNDKLEEVDDTEDTISDELAQDDLIEEEMDPESIKDTIDDPSNQEKATIVEAEDSQDIESESEFEDSEDSVETNEDDIPGSSDEIPAVTIDENQNRKEMNESDDAEETKEDVLDEQATDELNSIPNIDSTDNEYADKKEVTTEPVVDETEEGVDFSEAEADEQEGSTRTDEESDMEESGVDQEVLDEDDNEIDKVESNADEELSESDTQQKVLDEDNKETNEVESDTEFLESDAKQEILDESAQEDEETSADEQTPEDDTEVDTINEDSQGETTMDVSEEITDQEDGDINEEEVIDSSDEEATEEEPSEGSIVETNKEQEVADIGSSRSEDTIEEHLESESDDNNESDKESTESDEGDDDKESTESDKRDDNQAPAGNQNDETLNDEVLNQPPEDPNTSDAPEEQSDDVEQVLEINKEPQEGMTNQSEVSDEEDIDNNESTAEEDNEEVGLNETNDDSIQLDEEDGIEQRADQNLIEENNEETEKEPPREANNTNEEDTADTENITTSTLKDTSIEEDLPLQDDSEIATGLKKEVLNDAQEDTGIEKRLDETPDVLQENKDREKIENEEEVQDLQNQEAADRERTKDDENIEEEQNNLERIAAIHAMDIEAASLRQQEKEELEQKQRLEAAIAAQQAADQLEIQSEDEATEDADTEDIEQFDDVTQSIKDSELSEEPPSEPHIILRDIIHKATTYASLRAGIYIPSSNTLSSEQLTSKIYNGQEVLNKLIDHINKLVESKNLLSSINTSSTISSESMMQISMEVVTQQGSTAVFARCELHSEEK